MRSNTETQELIRSLSKLSQNQKQRIAKVLKNDPDDWAEQVTKIAEENLDKEHLD